MNATAKDDDTSLKRLGGGRWETRDGRFTIEPQSGTWSLVDNEQTNELGLALVRGPFRSLTEARDAIAGARSGGPVASPLEKRLAEARKRPPAERRAEGASSRRGRSGSKRRGGDPEQDETQEPRWLTDLPAPDAKRARELIAKLEARGAADAEARVRADVVGGVPTVASTAIALRIRTLIDDVGEGPESIERLVADVAELMAGERDRELGVEWRLVDGEGRPIELTARQVRGTARA